MEIIVWLHKFQNVLYSFSDNGSFFKKTIDIWYAHQKV